MLTGTDNSFMAGCFGSVVGKWILISRAPPPAQLVFPSIAIQFSISFTSQWIDSVPFSGLFQKFPDGEGFGIHFILKYGNLTPFRFGYIIFRAVAALSHIFCFYKTVVFAIFKLLLYTFGQAQFHTLIQCNHGQDIFRRKSNKVTIKS